jgi:hypothetical protein
VGEGYIIAAVDEAVTEGEQRFWGILGNHLQMSAALRFSPKFQKNNINIKTRDQGI